jgi:hypothetical protein
MGCPPRSPLDPPLDERAANCLYTDTPPAWWICVGSASACLLLMQWTVLVQRELDKGAVRVSTCGGWEADRERLPWFLGTRLVAGRSDLPRIGLGGRGSMSRIWLFSSRRQTIWECQRCTGPTAPLISRGRGRAPGNSAGRRYSSSLLCIGPIRVVQSHRYAVLCGDEVLDSCARAQ